MNGIPAWAVQHQFPEQHLALLWSKPKQPAVPAEGSPYPFDSSRQQVMGSSDKARHAQRV